MARRLFPLVPLLPLVRVLPPARRQALVAVARRPPEDLLDQVAAVAHLAQAAAAAHRGAAVRAAASPRSFALPVHPA